ncbi:MAG TPA: flippase-like domain-containing protein [Thermoplasmatales archaeon]|nr:flippase-like domain-containing protein [Thermoplasmatales archaeon]
MNWRIIKTVLPLTGVFLFIYIVHSIGLQNITDEIIRIPPIYLTAVTVLSFPRVAISTYKWWYIARTQKIKLPYTYMLKVNFIGTFGGVVTPLGLGDFIRVPLVQKKSGEKFAKCLANWLIDQAIEIFSLFLLATIGTISLALFFPKYKNLFTPVVTVFSILLITSILFVENRRGKKLFKLLSKLILPDKHKNWLEEHVDAFYDEMPKVKKLFFPFSVEVIMYSIMFLQIYLIAVSLNINVPITWFIILYAIASLIGQIPITVGGLGTREGALIGLFSLFNVQPHQIVAVSLMGYIVTMLVPAATGGVLSFTINKGFKQTN